MKTILCIILLSLLTISKLSANEAYNHCGETLEEHTNAKGEYCLNAFEESCNGAAASNYSFTTQRFEIRCLGMDEETFTDLYERVDE